MLQDQDRREMMFHGTKEEMEKLEELLGRPGHSIVTSNPDDVHPEIGLITSGARILGVLAKHLGLSPERTRDWAELEYEDQQTLATIAAGNMKFEMSHALDQDTIELLLRPETGLPGRITSGV